MPTLTTKLIERTRPRSKRIEISCSVVRGLLLRVLPSGKKVLLYRHRAGGQDNKVRLGLFGDGTGDTVTLAEAREQAARLAIMGSTVALSLADEARAPESVEKRRISFSDLVAEFSRRHVETDALRDRTKKYYRKALSESLLVWGPRSLDSIRFADVEEFHRQNSHRPSAANNYIRVLHLMFEKAVQWEMFERRNPAHGIKLFKENKRKRYLTTDERRRLNRVLNEALLRNSGTGGPQARWSHVYGIRLLLLTGMRLSEVLNLQWSWIWAERLEVILPDSKTGQSVRPISPAVLDLLDELEPYRVDGVPFVVYGRNNQRIDPASLRSAWSRLRAAAGLDDVRLHDLRHSAASDAISSGCTLQEVGAILGHKNPATTARYAHLSSTAAKAAAKRMTDSIAKSNVESEPLRPARRRKKKKKTTTTNKNGTE